MLYWMTGHQQLILAGVVRHLDHKNVTHDPEMKCHIIQTASCLARQVRAEGVISDMGFVSDLFRHLRKSFQATAEPVGEQELNVNAALQTSIESCLLETVRGVLSISIEILFCLPTFGACLIGLLLFRLLMCGRCLI